MKTISDFKFKGKRVLLRADLNSDVVGGKVVMSERIKGACKSIKELKLKGARVVVIAHQGRKGKKDFISLKGHARLLNKFVKVKFVDDVVGKKAVDEIEKLKNGEVLLLENIRFLKEEIAGGKNKFVDRLVELSDIYVNDAFSVCHRKHSSIVSFPKYLPHCGGRLLIKEVAMLKKIKIKNCLFLLGGAKPEDNMILFDKNEIISGGLFGQMCLIAKGKSLGAQDDYLKKNIDGFNFVVNKLKKVKNLKKVETPCDFAVKVKGKRVEVGLDKFPNEFEIFDIGEDTIEKYVKEIKKAKIVFMKGPFGDCSDKKFCKGTFSILKAVAGCRGFSVIGGGHLSDAIEKSDVNKKKFGYISLSGGALLRYIAGEKLVGLEALSG